MTERPIDLAATQGMIEHRGNQLPYIISTIRLAETRLRHVNAFLIPHAIAQIDGRSSIIVDQEMARMMKGAAFGMRNELKSAGLKEEADALITGANPSIVKKQYHRRS